MNEKKINNVGRNDPCPCGARKIDDLPRKYKYCCLNKVISQKSRSKSGMQTLKVLPDEMNDKHLCLEILFKILDSMVSQDFIRTLASIGRKLDTRDIQKVNEELVNQHCTNFFKDELSEDLINGAVCLFNPYALRIIDELLRVEISERPKLLGSKTSISIDFYNRADSKAIEQNLRSIEGIFLLANTLVLLVKNEIFPRMQNDEKARIFYSRTSLAKPSALGRARIYSYSDFPSRLQRISLNVEEYMKSVFALCAHVEAQPFMEIELSSSLEKVGAYKAILAQYISRLCGKIKSDFLHPGAALSKFYYAKQMCRQRPLLEIGGRYYCLQPSLLWAALADLPFYLLLDSFKMDKDGGDELWQFYGNLFEQNWRDLGARVFKKNSCKDFQTKNNHKDLDLHSKHRVGDLLVELDKDAIAIFEFKGATPNDAIKQGDKDKLFSKFVDLEDDKGVSQLCTDAEVYRRETGFKEYIYIILVFRGPLPLTSSFDADVEKYLSTHSEYQAYLLNSKNKALLVMDETWLELLFSAIRQGLPRKKAFQQLSGLLPSKIPQMLYKQISYYHLNDTSAILYEEEIKAHEESSRAMF